MRASRQQLHPYEVHPFHLAVPPPKKTTQKPQSWFRVRCPGLSFPPPPIPRPPPAGIRHALQEGVSQHLPELQRGRAAAQGGPAESKGAGCKAHWQHGPREASGQKCREEKSIFKWSLNMRRVGHSTLYSCVFPDPGDGKMCGKSSSCPASISWWGKIFLQQSLYYKFVWYLVYKQ